MKLKGKKLLNNIERSAGFQRICVLSSLTVKIFSNKNCILDGAMVFMKREAQEKFILFE